MINDLNWNKELIKLPNYHILQSTEWGRFKSLYGWESNNKTWANNSNNIFALANVLQRSFKIRNIILPLNISYIPRGPVLDWNIESQTETVINSLEVFAKNSSSIFIKIDPELITGYGATNTPDSQNNKNALEIISNLIDRKWIYSKEQIQFKNTVVINIDSNDNVLLSKMKQKTRYNIRLAERKGVKIRKGTVDDFPMLYQLYAETSIRDGFTIRSKQYYFDVWNIFFNSNMAEALIAEVNNEPVAGLFLFYFHDRAWYLYGMSSHKHREKMPNYLLQWNAIKLARSKGCKYYDLWGAPDIFNESDPMWGVYRFKMGLGGKVIRTSGAWDYTSRPNLYTLYTRVLPQILNVMRNHGNKKTLSSLNIE